MVSKIKLPSKPFKKPRRIEARIKAATGAGMWPAFWMLGVNSREPDTTWPLCGEIDIMEVWGDADTEQFPSSEIFGTIHFGENWPANLYSGEQTRVIDGVTYTDFGEDFHVYAIEWDEDGEIRWYFNDTLYGTRTYNNANGEYSDQVNPEYGWWTSADPDSMSNNSKAPFDKHFYIIMNLAVGGSSFSGKITNSTLSSTLSSSDPVSTKLSILDSLNAFDGDNALMIVDWVRIYGFENETTYTLPEQSSESLTFSSN